MYPLANERFRLNLELAKLVPSKKVFITILIIINSIIPKINI